jgi:hypothetical protein
MANGRVLVAGKGNAPPQGRFLGSRGDVDEGVLIKIIELPV